MTPRVSALLLELPPPSPILDKLSYFSMSWFTLLFFPLFVSFFSFSEVIV